MQTVNHSMSVSGIVASKGNNEDGTNTSKTVGVAYKSEVIPLLVDFLDDQTITAAIEYAVDNNANIINMSFGGGSMSPDNKIAVENAYHVGVFLVGSTGNTNQDYGTNYSAAHPLVFGVGASDPNDLRGSIDNTTWKWDSSPTVIGSNYYTPTASIDTLL